jgi:hypothetical protein
MNQAMSGVTPLDADSLRRVGLFTPAMLASEVQKEPQQYVVDGLIAQRSRNLLVGDNGIGKTPFLMALGAAVASGRPFLERAVKQGPVVYFDAEMGRDQFHELLETVSHHMGLSEPPQEFFVWSSNWSDVDETISAGFSRSLMASIVEQVRPRLVIVDPIRAFFPGVDTQKGAAVEMLSFERELSRKYGVAWQNLHHRRKTNHNAMSQPDLLDDPRTWLQESSGEYSLVNHHDTRVGLEASRMNGVDLIVGGFSRGQGPIAPIFLRRAYGTNDEPVGYEVLSGMALLPLEYQAVLKALPSPFRFADVRAALNTNSDSGTKRCIDRLIQAKVIAKEGEHKKTLYHKIT